MEIQSNKQRRVGPAIWLLAMVSMCGVAGQRCLCFWGSNHGPCGDNHVNDGEECDGPEFLGRTCEEEGFAGGELACTELCELDTSGCVATLCGDGVVQPEEVCDGDFGLGETCYSLGYLGGGTLLCRADCTGYVTVHCAPNPFCGNGVREGEEACDGMDLGGESCVTLGYSGGTLTCDSCTTLDESGCIGASPCGDGLAVAPEVCDGADFGGLACVDYGYPAGALVCRPDCSEVLLTGCGTWDATCGDGLIQPGEQCDGLVFDAADDCVSRGYLGGSLACDPWCRVDVQACQGDLCELLARYGDGWCDLCERQGGVPDPDCGQLCPAADAVCVSYRDEGLGVSTCLYATGAEDPDCGSCGDGVQGPAELCDGTDIPASCALFGYQSGTPAACDSACVPDLSSCVP